MKTILGIDIGGSKVMVALITVTTPDNSANYSTIRIEKLAKRELRSDCTKELLLEEIESAMCEIKAEGCFSAIGVTIPGLADPANEIWVYACFSGISNFPIVAELRRRYGNFPISIENDVNACAFAEKRFGCCREVDDFIWITVSNGIGGGLVLGGKIYSGHFGNAGEIGHINVVENGRLCGCGNRGCLEAEVAGPGIAYRYRQEYRPESTATAKEIADLARLGEQEAIATYEKTGRLLGKAMAAAANLINPAKIVIGGGVSGSFDLFYPGLIEKFEAESFRAADRGVIIEPTALGYEAALAGAAAIALE